jgi:hypothetical protein
MGKRRKKASEKPTVKDSDGDLWVAPRYSLKGPNGERAWENRPGGPPSNSRYLELADIAMGHKKPAPKKRKEETPATHQISKTEPYNP